jgi:hypothetical protein
LHPVHKNRERLSPNRCSAFPPALVAPNGSAGIVSFRIDYSFPTNLPMLTQ